MGCGRAGQDESQLARLRPNAYTHLLPTQRVLSPKGALIDCTLKKRLDSFPHELQAY
jgi:hypothetical protein